MTYQQVSKTKPASFTRAFEQICNFAAVAKTGQPLETIKGLIELCFVLVPDQVFDDTKQLSEAIEMLFGIPIHEHEVKVAVFDLLRQNIISQPAGTNYVLSAQTRRELNASVKAVMSTEQKVKAAWLEEEAIALLGLDVEALWKTLQGYLQRAFRRHGVQAAALLDPSIITPGSTEDGLSFLLDDVIKDYFAEGQSGNARTAISGFLAHIGSNPDRAQYIAQLADAAFSFYSLQITPESSEKLRQSLTELVLFLDTNFLFGILGLSHNPQVDVSLDLLRAIEKYKLPFKLRYHTATEREMLNTITYYGDVLRSRHWTRELSRAVSASRNVSGIELKFHELNARQTVDVDEFLRPYEHFDVLLKNKGITIFRTKEDRTLQVSELYNELNTYLQESGKGEKSYETVEHDAKLLDAVRNERKQAKSSIEAGALLVTCDYYLYRFDWDMSRRENKVACAVLPNILWQFLRPYIPSDLDFERVFAETFALPEFRVIGSGGSRAATKMLQMLASYADIPEETALKLLSNDLLLERLKGARDNEEFEKLVEAAIVAQNAELIEERAALEKKVEEEKQRRSEIKVAYEIELAKKDVERVGVERKLANKTEELEKERKNTQKEKERAEKAMSDAKTFQQAAKDKDQSIAQLEANQKKLERSRSILTNVFAGFLAIALAIGFEIIANSVPWKWLIDHHNSLPLQIFFDLIIMTMVLGVFLPKYRKWLWGINVLWVLALGLISLLGK